MLQIQVNPILADIFFALLLLGLAWLFWFKADILGSFTGYVGRGHYIDRETPGCLLKPLGVFFLLCFFKVLWELIGRLFA